MLRTTLWEESTHLSEVVDEVDNLGLGEAQGLLGGESVEQPQELVQLVLQALSAVPYQPKFLLFVQWVISRC